MKKIFARFFPIIFIFLVWFIFSSPYFVRGKVPYPSTYHVNFFHPWSSNEKFWGPVKNNAMPDIIDQIYPWRHFTIEMWKSGHIPFWNPNSFSGNPHLANFQSAVFSPFNLLFFFLSFVDAWSILVLLQPLLAGLFMYFFVREAGVSKSGSIISSISFMFCGFMVVWMAYGTLSMAISFLPLILFSVEKYFKKPRFLWLLLLAFSISFSFFSGHFQTSLYVFLFSVAFFIFKSCIVKDAKKSGYIALFLFFGICLSLIQIIPSIQLYLYSVRSGIFLTSGGIPFSYFVTIFAPDFFGNPVTRNDWFGYYAEWSSFIGIIPLFLGLFSVIDKKNKTAFFFFFFGILSLLFALQSPFLKLLGDLKIPVLSTSTPSRIIVLFSFSFAVISGIGFDKLTEYIIAKKLRKITLLCSVVIFVLVFIWIDLFIFKALPSDKFIIAKSNFILPTFLFLCFLILITTASRINKKYMSVFMFCVVILVSFDSIRFAQKWMPFDPKNLVFVDLPVISAIKKNVEYGRVFGNLGAHIDTYYNIPSIEGYDPLYIDRYGELIESASTGEFSEAGRSVVKLNRNGKYTDRILDLLGVSIIFHPINDTYQGWAYPVWKDEKRFSVVYQDEKFQLFKNNSAMSRASLFYDYEVIQDKKAIIKEFYRSDFDFRSKLILEEKPSIDIKKSKGSVTISNYSPSRVKMSVQAENTSLLLLTDNYYPGWHAYVNGKETKIFRADYTLRAIVVPMGNSEVEFKYTFF